MRRLIISIATVVAVLVVAGPTAAATNASVAALQVALRANGHYPAAVDGVDGPLTRTGLTSFQARIGVPPTGRVEPQTRRALGALGKPLLGQRELGIGAVGWDVSSLEFKLVAFGLSRKAVDGRFTAATAKALVRFQASRSLPADGIAGKRTFAALAGAKAPSFAPPLRPARYTVKEGDGFYTIAASLGISPLVLAKQNGLELTSVIVPGQKLELPTGTTTPQPNASDMGRPVAPSGDAVRASLDRWSAVYGVDPKLARATAWMESGFRHDVVSEAGAVGVMQLLPGTWKWVEQVLLRTTTPRTYDGNVRVGVRYLRWLLDQFNGNTRLALAGYYQGAQAVRDRGLFDDTKRYVAIILKLHGTV
jgi:peptidoglycan hydrolase-like protein with peptidoglycan-binding domain